MKTHLRRATRQIILALLLLAAATASWAQTPAGSGIVITIYGTGASGPIDTPQGLTVGPDGRLFFCDNAHNQVKAMNLATGAVSVIAGTGTAGDSGYGGLATAAAIRGLTSLAFDGSGQLFIAESTNNRINKITAPGATLAAVAGLGQLLPGFTGDGGAALAARTLNPQGVEVSPSGNVYIADSGNRRIRVISALTGNISTISGTGFSSSTGDGGLASLATWTDPRRLVLDESGNIFILDRIGNTRVRRIDAGTNIVTSVAGGGTDAPAASGVATSMNFGFGGDLWAGGGAVVFTGQNQVFRLDVGTGNYTHLAGTSVAGFSGDGGPATAAQFNQLGGITVSPAGEIFLSDALNDRIRYIVPDKIDLSNSGQSALALPYISSLLGGFKIDANALLATLTASALGNVVGDVIIINNPNLNTIDLTALTSAGSVTVAGNTVADAILIGNLVTVPLDLNISGNTSANVIDLTALTSAGSVTVAGNTVADAILIGNLVTVPLDLNISGNTAAETLDVGALASTGGDVIISDNTAATALDVGALASTGGDVIISGNTAAETLDVGALASTGGDVVVSNNDAATEVAFGALTSVSGDAVVSNNDAATEVAFDALTSVGGDAMVSNNDAATEVAFDALTSVGGDALVSNNDAATQVAFGALTTVGGDLTVTDNGTATNVALPTTDATVEGNTTIETGGQAVVDASHIETGGALDIEATGAETVLGQTGAMGTEVTLVNGTASMTLEFPFGTFMEPTQFSVSKLGGEDLFPRMLESHNYFVDPLSAYAIDFDFPLSGLPLLLTFEINLPLLTGPERLSVLEAVESGRLLLGMRGTYAPVYLLFTIGNFIVPDLIATLALLDASGMPVTEGVEPTLLRFQAELYAPFAGDSAGVSQFSASAFEAEANQSATFEIMIARPMSALEAWRLAHFGGTEDAGNAAGLADPNHNGIANLIEYALNGDPSGSATGTAVLPVSAIGPADKLALQFTRYPSRSGVTLTVQGADTLPGPWTDLARSLAGTPFTSLAPGVVISETPSGANWEVTITGTHSLSGGPGTRGFMRLSVEEPP